MTPKALSGEDELPTTTVENVSTIGWVYKDGKWVCIVDGKEITKEQEETLWTEELLTKENI